MLSSTEVCIIGAGISGSFLSYLLSQNPKYNITVIEMGRGIGGRMAVHRFVNLGNITNFNIGHTHIKLTDSRILKHLKRFNVKFVEETKYNQCTSEIISGYIIEPNKDIGNYILKKMMNYTRNYSLIEKLFCYCMPQKQTTILFNTLAISVIPENGKYIVLTNTNKELRFDIVINTSPINCNQYFRDSFKIQSPFYQVSKFNQSVNTILSKLNNNMTPVSNDTYIIFLQGLYFINYMQYSIFSLIDKSKYDNFDYLMRNPIEEIRINKNQMYITCLINPVFSQKYNYIVNEQSMEYRYNQSLEVFRRGTVMYNAIWDQLINFLKLYDNHRMISGMTIDRFVDIYVMYDYYHKWTNAYNYIKANEHEKDKYIKLDEYDIYLVGDYISSVNSREYLLQNALQSSMALADRLNGVNFKYNYEIIKDEN